MKLNLTRSKTHITKQFAANATCHKVCDMLVQACLCRRRYLGLAIVTRQYYASDGSAEQG